MLTAYVNAAIDKNLLNEILKEIGIDKTKWGEL